MGTSKKLLYAISTGVGFKKVLPMQVNPKAKDYMLWSGYQLC